MDRQTDRLAMALGVCWESRHIRIVSFRSVLLTMTLYISEFLFLALHMVRQGLSLKCITAEDLIARKCITNQALHKTGHPRSAVSSSTRLWVFVSRWTLSPCENRCLTDEQTGVCRACLNLSGRYFRRPISGNYTSVLTLLRCAESIDLTLKCYFLRFHFNWGLNTRCKSTTCNPPPEGRHHGGFSTVASD